MGMNRTHQTGFDELNTFSDVDDRQVVKDVADNNSAIQESHVRLATISCGETEEQNSGKGLRHPIILPAGFQLQLF